MFSKILICSDGSECARNAARAGAEIARRFGSEVLLLNVFDLSFMASPEVGVWAATFDQETINECFHDERKATEGIVKPLFEQAGVPYKMVQVTGHPVDGILDLAEREQIDLIVLGSRGLSGLKEFFLGSVSQGVLHHANCAVLIAGGDCKALGEAGFQSILLASDGSHGAQMATGAAVELAQKFSTSLTVLHVIDPHPSRAAGHEGDLDVGAGVHPDPESLRKFDSIHKTVQCASDKTGVACSFRRECGRPGETIVRFAREHDSDLIVMGSRGLGGFKRLLLGSISNYVGHHAGCPILVVR